MYNIIVNNVENNVGPIGMGGVYIEIRNITNDNELLYYDELMDVPFEFLVDDGFEYSVTLIDNAVPNCRITKNVDLTTTTTEEPTTTTTTQEPTTTTTTEEPTTTTTEEPTTTTTTEEPTTTTTTEEPTTTTTTEEPEIYNVGQEAAVAEEDGESIPDSDAYIDYISDTSFSVGDSVTLDYDMDPEMSADFVRWEWRAESGSYGDNLPITTNPGTIPSENLPAEDILTRVVLENVVLPTIESTVTVQILEDGTSNEVGLTSFTGEADVDTFSIDGANIMDYIESGPDDPDYYWVSWDNASGYSYLTEGEKTSQILSKTYPSDDVTIIAYVTQ